MIHWQLIFCLGLLVFLYCLKHACEAGGAPPVRKISLWGKRSGYQDILCLEAISGYVTNIDITRCILQCQQSMNCHSIFYINGTIAYCYFVNVTLFLTDGCESVLNAEHYFPGTEPSCHPNDEVYRTVQLSDGSFTYKIVDSRSVNQSTALQDCERAGANLAKLSTLPRLEFFRNFMTDCPGFDVNVNYIIGGSNADAEDYLADGAWTWYDGEPMLMNTTLWGEGEPSAAQSAHCVTIKKRFGWTVYDSRCHHDNGYICAM